MTDTITTHKITQAEANSLMENLSGQALENFNLGFHDEKDNILMKRKPIALSPEDRSYYLVRVKNIDYLLVGINLNPNKTANLSSYARITTRRNVKAATCLKRLLEQELVPLCRSLGKERILSYAYTERSARVFASLLRSILTYHRQSDKR